MKRQKRGRKKNLFWKWISIQKSGKKKFRYPGFLTTTVVERVSFFVLKNLINDMIWPIESAQLCFQSIAVKIIAELSRAQHGSPETNASLYGKSGHNALLRSKKVQSFGLKGPSINDVTNFGGSAKHSTYLPFQKWPNINFVAPEEKAQYFQKCFVFHCNFFLILAY